MKHLFSKNSTNIKSDVHGYVCIDCAGCCVDGCANVCTSCSSFCSWAAMFN